MKKLLGKVDRIEWFLVLSGPARLWLALCGLLCGVETGHELVAGDQE
jgi:hypothetical protein